MAGQLLPPPNPRSPMRVKEKKGVGFLESFRDRNCRSGVVDRNDLPIGMSVEFH